MLSRPESCDPAQFPSRPRRVLNLFETHPIELYHLTIRKADGRRETLGTTGNHPFFAASEQRFVPARELRSGCRVVTVTAAIAEVEAVEVHTAAAGESFTTHNIEVEEDHTDHVGELGSWAHNEPAERCLELAREAADGNEEAVAELRRIFSKAPDSGGVSTVSYMKSSMKTFCGGLTPQRELNFRPSAPATPLQDHFRTACIRGGSLGKPTGQRIRYKGAFG